MKRHVERKVEVKVKEEEKRLEIPDRLRFKWSATILFIVASGAYAYFFFD